MKAHFLLGICLFALLSHTVVCDIQAVPPEMILQNRNKVTPHGYKDNYAKPAIFPNTNNLRRKSGSPFLAKGEPLVLKGQLTDLANAPIQNATIKIWQANQFGYYNHLVDINDTAKHDIDFLSSGKCITNNMGYYSFTTIMPGYYGNRVPHIHMSVEHPDFESIETEVIFPDEPRSEFDEKIATLKPIERALLTCFVHDHDLDHPHDGKIAVFNIKLDGLHKTRQY